MLRNQTAILTAKRKDANGTARDRTESAYRRYAIADDRDLRVAVERLDSWAGPIGVN